ncbi:MAG: dihydroneopterin aldolase [Puniceicoccales bacterium]|jgi:dihydroneopterin aldolase|nr:dihydroneopterin aldolase [Puniceicoccales bacterium]
MDTVFIRGLELRGHHGVFAEERRLGQVFVVSLELGLDTRAAAEADELALTVDYAAVVGCVRGVVEGESVRLIETLAGRIADAVLREFPLVRHLSVEVQKPQAPVPARISALGVVISRGR